MSLLFDKNQPLRSQVLATGPFSASRGKLPKRETPHKQGFSATGRKDSNLQPPVLELCAGRDARSETAWNLTLAALRCAEII